MLDKNFRSVPSAGFPEGVFADPKNPLVLIDVNGLSCYANDLVSKQALLESYEPGVFHDDTRMLLFTWQGKFKSDVFQISAEKAEDILNTLNPKV